MWCDDDFTTPLLAPTDSMEIGDLTEEDLVNIGAIARPSLAGDYYAEGGCVYLRGGPDDTWGATIFFPCANSFFAPNQKQYFFLSGKGTSNFFPQITPFFCQFCEKIFFYSLLNKQFFHQFVLNPFFVQKNIPSTYHLVHSLRKRTL